MESVDGDGERVSLHFRVGGGQRVCGGDGGEWGTCEGGIGAGDDETKRAPKGYGDEDNQKY